jgi:hypothetical protein
LPTMDKVEFTVLNHKGRQKRKHQNILRTIL